MLRGAFFVLILNSIFALEIEIQVPLFINSEIICDVPVILETESDLVKVENETLKVVVKDYLTEQGLLDLKAFLETIGYVPENTSKGNEKFGIYFSTVDQTLHLETKLDLLKTKYTNVTRPRAFGGSKGGKKIQPSAFSGYLNLEGGIRDRRNFINAFRPEGLQSFGNLNCCLHYKDTILTGFGYFLHDNTWGINPVNAVLSKEFKESGMKWAAGTINSAGISFQGSLPIIGINLSKNSDLITDSTLGSMSRHDLFLNAPSEIRVIINGIDVNRLDLPAGNHVLQNFPLAQGLNNVVLKILGPTGEERDVDITMFYNPALMRKGDIETNVTVGYPSYDIQKGSEGFYSMSVYPAFSGYLRGGIADDLTLAGYFQALKSKIFTGVQGIYARPYFKTISEVGLSFDVFENPCFKTRIALLQPDAWKIPILWNFAFEGTQKGFRYFGGANKNQETAFLFSSSLSANIYSVMSANIVYQYGYLRNAGNKNSVQGTLSVRPMPWLCIRGMLKWVESDLRPGTTETAINFDLTPRYKDFGTKTMYNSRQKALTSAITYNKALSGRRSVAGNIGFNNAPGSNQLEGRFAYDGRLIRANASQQLYKSSLTDIDSTTAVTNASLATALVFADRKVAVSRPIRDSFVIIAPNKYLRNAPVVVNPSGKDYTARATYFFPAVIPINSYNSLDVSVVREDGSYGGDFENTSYNIKSLNKSGAVLDVGDQPKVIVEGVLYDKGKPSENITGMMISEFEVKDKKLKYRFFTDEDGVFQVLDVVPGKYSIRFTNKYFCTIKNVEVELDDDGINYINIGDYNIERIPEDKKRSEMRK
ncbi:MAG: hypothetical protein S4CHLAM20_01830 [Chlamydiia bacterium]|nr:hypothetical protein [Chlamydiia bacterium]